MSGNRRGSGFNANRGRGSGGGRQGFNPPTEPRADRERAGGERSRGRARGGRATSLPVGRQLPPSSAYNGGTQQGQRAAASTGGARGGAGASGIANNGDSREDMVRGLGRTASPEGERVGRQRMTLPDVETSPAAFYPPEGQYVDQTDLPEGTKDHQGRNCQKPLGSRPLSSDKTNRLSHVNYADLEKEADKRVRRQMSKLEQERVQKTYWQGQTKDIVGRYNDLRADHAMASSRAEAMSKRLAEAHVEIAILRRLCGTLLVGNSLEGVGRVMADVEDLSAAFQAVQSVASWQAVQATAIEAGQRAELRHRGVTAGSETSQAAASASNAVSVDGQAAVERADTRLAVLEARRLAVEEFWPRVAAREAARLAMEEFGHRVRAGQGDDAEGEGSSNGGFNEGVSDD